MKIHFLSPPSPKGRMLERLYGCSYGLFHQQNIFALSLATCLSQNNVKVEFTEADVDGVTNLEHFVRMNSADVYVIYSVFLSRDCDLKAARTIRRYKPNSKIIFAGSDPTYDPTRYLLDSNCFVVRGEGESTLCDLVNRFDEVDHVQGVSFVSDGEIVNNPPRGIIRDLDSHPPPDRSLLKNPFRYYNPKFSWAPSAVVGTSRGCPYRCIFCVPNSLSFAREIEWKRYNQHKPPPTMRSVQAVLSEFEEIKRQGFESAQIIDDLFTVNTERAIEICEGLQGLGLELACLSRADHLTNEDLVRAMAQGGVKTVDVGAESFCQPILDFIRKDLQVTSCSQAIRLLKRYGIRHEINLMLGSSPLETEKTVRHSICVAKSFQPDVLHLSICTPFPGTDFYNMAKEKGWMTTTEYNPSDPLIEASISYPHLRKEQLEELASEAYLFYYMSPRYVFSRLSRIHNLYTLKYNLRSAIAFFSRIIGARFNMPP